MGELGPGHRDEQQRREEEIDAEEDLGRQQATGGLHDLPDEGEQGARHEAADEQVGGDQPVGRILLVGDVYPQEEEEPAATDEDHHRPDVPQDRPDRRGGHYRRRKDIDHHDGRDDVEQKAVEQQEVRHPALNVAELAGGQHLLAERPQHQGELLDAADPALGPGLRVSPALHEILEAAFVEHVVYRPGGDRQDHQDDVDLHEGRG